MKIDIDKNDIRYEDKNLSERSVKIYKKDDKHTDLKFVVNDLTIKDQTKFINWINNSTAIKEMDIKSENCMELLEEINEDIDINVNINNE